MFNVSCGCPRSLSLTVYTAVYTFYTENESNQPQRTVYGYICPFDLTRQLLPYKLTFFQINYCPYNHLTYKHSMRQCPLMNNLLSLTFYTNKRINAIYP